MSRYLCGLATSLVLLAATGQAQEETPVPPPHAPFVAVPKPGTSWQIAVQHTNVTPPNADGKKTTANQKLPVTITCHRGAETTYIVVTWSDGTRTDGYVQGGHLLQKGDNGKITMLPTEDESYSLPVYTRGYQGTAWVNLAGYKQVEKIGEKKTYKYLGHFKVDLEGTAPLILELDAWIGVDDGLPLRVVMGPLIYTFGLVTAAPEPVELPADFQAFIDKIAKVEKAQEAMRKAIQLQGR